MRGICARYASPSASPVFAPPLTSTPASMPPLKMSQTVRFLSRPLALVSRPMRRSFPTRYLHPRTLATLTPTPPRVDHAQSSDNQTVAAMGRTASGRDLKIRKYPTFERKEDERLYRKQHLAAAYRVFAERGFDEGVAGHISVRDPVWEDHFCKFYRSAIVGSTFRDHPG